MLSNLKNLEQVEDMNHRQESELLPIKKDLMSEFNQAGLLVAHNNIKLGNYKKGAIITTEETGASESCKFLTPVKSSVHTKLWRGGLLTVRRPSDLDL